MVGKIWNELYNSASKVLKPRKVSEIIEAAGVAAAIESSSGNICRGMRRRSVYAWYMCGAKRNF